VSDSLISRVRASAAVPGSLNATWPLAPMPRIWRSIRRPRATPARIRNTCACGPRRGPRSSGSVPWERPPRRRASRPTGGESPRVTRGQVEPLPTRNARTLRNESAPAATCATSRRYAGSGVAPPAKLIAGSSMPRTVSATSAAAISPTSSASAPIRTRTIFPVVALAFRVPSRSCARGSGQYRRRRAVVANRSGAHDARSIAAARAARFAAPIPASASSSAARSAPSRGPGESANRAVFAQARGVPARRDGPRGPERVPVRLPHDARQPSPGDDGRRHPQVAQAMAARAKGAG